MPVTLYRCDFTDPNSQTKSLTRLSVPAEEAYFPLSKACIVYRYAYLYRRESGRFTAYDTTPYALPGRNKQMRSYDGFDRNPLDYTPDAEEPRTYDEIRALRQSLPNSGNLETIFVRVADSGESIPQGLDFLGYDACYTPDSDGFSAICDCMFLCRWHGCDETGTAFADDFGRLNTHGLFRSKRETEDYLCRYLMQEWAETGDFCVLEVYR